MGQAQNPDSAQSQLPHPAPHAEPHRPADAVRLDLTRLRIEEGVKLGSVFPLVTERAAEILKVERVGVWLMVDQRRALRCIDLYESSKKAHSAGTTLQVQDFPEYFAALERRKTMPAEVAQADSRTIGLTEAYLVPLGITSMLDAPIFIGGEMIGVLCHEHVGSPREWTTEERDFAGSMADLLALKIKAAEIEDARHILRTQAVQLAEARKLESLARMASGVAHDFSNILSIVMGVADLIATDPSASPSVIQSVQQMAEAVRRGKALSSQLMDFARPGPHSARVVRPAEVISAQLPLLQVAAGERHWVTLDKRGPTGSVLIAPDELERLVLNLVVNARDAMAEGGAIEVVLDDVCDCDEDCMQARFVLIEVRDHGVGIPEDEQEKIFEPFFTTKPQGHGTGLGLAVANQIVSSAGGFIRVQSTLGQGSALRIYLPRLSS